MLKIKAIGVSEGLARAKALVIRDVDLTVVRNTVTDIEAEQQRATWRRSKTPRRRSRRCGTRPRRISARRRRRSLTRI